MDQLRSLQCKTLDILSKAEQEGDLRVAVAAIAQARGNLELFAKLLGELSETTVNVLVSPQWIELRSVILNAVEPFPDARLALVEALNDVRK
ncbi:MAG TPA: hypothetical protein VGK87_00060 [Anaerolineae bacterium]|jgi:hypothetical protein